MAFEGLGATTEGHTILAQDNQYAILELNRDVIDKQITQIVRQSQKAGKTFDWRGMIETFTKVYGKNQPDVQRLESLFQQLEMTNPYK